MKVGVKMIFEKIRERLELYRFDIQETVSKVLEKYGFPNESVVQDEIQYELDNFFDNKDTIDIINQVEAEYNNGWIPCSERLPEDDATMWVTYIEYGKELTATGYYDCESGYWYVGYFDYKTKNVTHWQPLPQLPKGE